VDLSVVDLSDEVNTSAVNTEDRVHNRQVLRSDTSALNTVTANSHSGTGTSTSTSPLPLLPQEEVITDPFNREEESVVRSTSISCDTQNCQVRPVYPFFLKPSRTNDNNNTNNNDNTNNVITDANTITDTLSDEAVSVTLCSKKKSNSETGNAQERKQQMKRKSKNNKESKFAENIKMIAVSDVNGRNGSSTKTDVIIKPEVDKLDVNPSSLTYVSVHVNDIKDENTNDPAEALNDEQQILEPVLPSGRPKRQAVLNTLARAAQIRTLYEASEGMVVL
jgi:hypothetical protein